MQEATCLVGLGKPAPHQQTRYGGMERQFMTDALDGRGVRLPFGPDGRRLRVGVRLVYHDTAPFPHTRSISATSVSEGRTRTRSSRARTRTGGTWLRRSISSATRPLPSWRPSTSASASIVARSAGGEARRIASGRPTSPEDALHRVNLVDGHPRHLLVHLQLAGDDDEPVDVEEGAIAAEGLGEDHRLHSTGAILERDHGHRVALLRPQAAALADDAADADGRSPDPRAPRCGARPRARGHGGSGRWGGRSGTGRAPPSRRPASAPSVHGATSGRAGRRLAPAAASYASPKSWCCPRSRSRCRRLPRSRAAVEHREQLRRPQPRRRARIRRAAGGGPSRESQAPALIRLSSTRRLTTFRSTSLAQPVEGGEAAGGSLRAARIASIGAVADVLDRPEPEPDTLRRDRERQTSLSLTSGGRIVHAEVAALAEIEGQLVGVLPLRSSGARP